RQATLRSANQNPSSQSNARISQKQKPPRPLLLERRLALRICAEYRYKLGCPTSRRCCETWDCHARRVGWLLGTSLLQTAPRDIAIRSKSMNPSTTEAKMAENTAPEPRPSNFLRDRIAEDLKTTSTTDA